MNPYIVAIVILIVFIIALIIAIVVINSRTTKTLSRISHMIDEAKEGEFKVKNYTEEEISSLECKFADFLDSSLTTEANLAEEKERIKEMISDISHQTKTPIANLLLYSELLGEEELSEGGKESINIIHEQTEKLRFLVDSLVKLSRLENGIVSLTAEQNSVKELVDSVVLALKNKASYKGLILCGPASDEEDVFAHFDMKWTTEALNNIVDNAIKYTDDGSIEVSISATDVFARIDVKDTGIGISEEESAKIFSRFYRSADVNQKEGVGIGLYLAREIITDEGGYIKLSSTKGEGSLFSIFLPV